MDAIDCLYRFWILKRRSVANRPLFIPLINDPEAANNTTTASPSEDNQREKLKKLVALRQDLERVSFRNFRSGSKRTKIWIRSKYLKNSFYYRLIFS